MKSLAEQTGRELRDVLSKLLKIGLDLLAVHYGMMLDAAAAEVGREPTGVAPHRWVIRLEAKLDPPASSD